MTYRCIFSKKLDNNLDDKIGIFIQRAMWHLFISNRILEMRGELHI